MKYIKKRNPNDMIRKNLSRQEFSEELSPFSKVAQGIYISENYDDINSYTLRKEKRRNKKKIDNIHK